MKSDVKVLQDVLENVAIRGAEIKYERGYY